MNRVSLVMERFRFIRALVFFLASCSGTRVSAQVSTATIAGVVQDSSKASIPGASVRLINTQTGAENDAMTSHDGGFVLPGVIPGAYTLQIERKGFATTQLRGIILNVGDTRDHCVRHRLMHIAIFRPSAFVLRPQSMDNEAKAPRAIALRGSGIRQTKCRRPR